MIKENVHFRNLVKQIEGTTFLERSQRKFSIYEFKTSNSGDHFERRINHKKAKKWINFIYFN